MVTDRTGSASADLISEFFFRFLPPFLPSFNRSRAIRDDRRLLLPLLEDPLFRPFDHRSPAHRPTGASDGSNN